jgi:Glyoxalase/Bleomycin resistance protein/Dioxygenase superfamily
MIKGVHTMFYSSEPDALRSFIRDKLKFTFTDVGEGWLIFDLPEAEMGCHPADPDKGATSGTHDISFYCDDVEKTMAELHERGVEFTDPVADHGYGLVTYFRMPGGLKVQLYQPRYVKKSAMKPATKKKAAKTRKKAVAKKRKSVKKAKR